MPVGPAFVLQDFAHVMLAIVGYPQESLVCFSGALFCAQLGLEGLGIPWLPGAQK